MLKIRKETDPVIISQVTNLIYGQPGIGKSSIAFTADKPLCFDFDKGAHRSAYSKDTVIIEKWDEVAKLEAKDLEGYNTIIIDTLGRCLDFITVYIGQKYPRYLQGDGTLAQKGYGTLKSIFSNWIKQLVLFNKDVILIAHDKEEKDRDNKYVRPDITGSSYNEVMKLIDFAGYYSIEDGKRILNFNPTDRSIGKNSAGFDALAIPDFNENPSFMAEVIAKQKTALSKNATKQQESEDIVKTISENYKSFVSAEDFNNEMSNLAELWKSGKKQEFKQLKSLLDKFATGAGLTYNKTDKKYEKVKVEDGTVDEVPF